VRLVGAPQWPAALHRVVALVAFDVSRRLSAALLVEAAGRFGTPLYVTDLDRAAANLAAHRAARPDTLLGARPQGESRPRAASAARRREPGAKWSTARSWRSHAAPAAHPRAS